MLVFPNAKINLGLNIISKRLDGFHDLQTVFYPVAINDALEILPKKNTEISFTTTGFSIDGTKENNICFKAFMLLKNDFPKISNISLHLHKAIPMGAGMGGGSADAAFVLLLLNKQFKLALSTNQLIEYALQLGSDCPFFILNKPAFATNRGENLSEVGIDLSKFKIVIIYPNIHINTAKAFENITPKLPEKLISHIILQPIETWKNELINDFEKNIFNQYPTIKTIKESLYKFGAIYAAMSGSGSTVFGIFTNEISLKYFTNQNYFAKIVG